MVPGGRGWGGGGVIGFNQVSVLTSGDAKGCGQGYQNHASLHLLHI